MKRSSFDLTHERKFTMQADGTLYPIMCEAVVPGDKFRVTSEILARFTPLINPIYHRFDIITHYFYVPNRLLWENWEKFIFPELMEKMTTGDDPVFYEPKFPQVHIADQSVIPYPFDCVVPQKFEVGTLADYLGICLQRGALPGYPDRTELGVSLLPFRAYQLIFNEWYRDQDLQDKIPVSLSDTVDFTSNENLQLFSFRKRCWEKDYFTSARPFAMKGSKPIVGEPFSTPSFLTDSQLGEDYALKVDGTTGNLMVDNWLGSEDTQVSVEPRGFTIEDLRYANALTKFLEKASRLGSRYTEAIKSFFGVTVPDFRLQRPEYLGGGRQPMVISEVLQTAQGEETPLGTYGGHGISSGKAGFNYMFPEHGYVIGLVSIMPRAGYVNAIRKDFIKNDRYDFFFPEFANLGEQAIKRAEIRGSLRIGDYPDLDWGYQERYAEYKFIPSTVHGAFKSDAILKTFVADRAGSDYELNSDFVQVSNSDQVERIFAIDAVNYDPVLVSCINRVSAVRPMPRKVVPKL